MKIAVAFATLSGNTAIVAQHLESYLTSLKHEVSLLDLSVINPDLLKTYELVVLGVSTYGDGDINPIGEMFFSLAETLGHSCDHTKFAIFALGDSSYSEFGTSGKLSSEKITGMDGRVLGPILIIDGYPDEKNLASSIAWLEEILIRV